MIATSRKLGVDTGWLVHLAITEHPDHASATNQMQGLRQQAVQFVLTPLVLTEFVHVATDAKRFRNPVEIGSAISFAETWWSDPRVQQVYPTNESVELAWHWMKQFKLGRKRILDTHLAAMWRLNNVVRILTANPADFSVFGVFEANDTDSNEPSQKA